MIDLEPGKQPVLWDRLRADTSEDGVDVACRVNNTDDGHSLVRDRVVDHIVANGKTPQAWPDLITRLSDQWLPDEHVEPIGRAINRAVRRSGIVSRNLEPDGIEVRLRNS